MTTLINPWNLGGVESDRDRLQAFAIFALCVAGKRADSTSQKVDKFLSARAAGVSPLEYVEWLDQQDLLEAALVHFKIGRYAVLTKGLVALAGIRHRLDEITVDELEALPAIGPKTSRFFLMYSRPDQKIACLDVHILRWLREQGVENVPAQTPQSPKQYARLERAYLDLCALRGRDPTDLDTEIWTAGAKRKAA